MLVTGTSQRKIQMLIFEFNSGFESEPEAFTEGLEKMIAVLKTKSSKV